MSEKAHVYFYGRVQGIFFRAFVRDEAIKLGITGWVRNLTNGSVEAVFEGDKETIKQMLEICKTGHPRARVDKIEVHWEGPENLKNFKIVY